jgi:hypothetical protein
VGSFDELVYVAAPIKLLACAWVNSTVGVNTTVAVPLAATDTA